MPLIPPTPLSPFQTAPGAKLEVSFKIYDADGDGKIGRDELTAMLRATADEHNLVRGGWGGGRTSSLSLLAQLYWGRVNTLVCFEAVDYRQQRSSDTSIKAVRAQRLSDDLALRLLQC